MKLSFCLAFLATIGAFAQAPAPPAAPAQATQASALMTLPPDAVVATVDGQKVYARELQAVMLTLTEDRRQTAMADPRSLLEQIGLLRRLSSMAEKAGLDQRSPLKEQLAYGRMINLAQAQLNEMANNSQVSPEDVKKFYEQNIDVYTQARVKLIYIPFVTGDSPAVQEGGDKKSLTESQAKAKAEQLYAQLQAGADFVKLVREHSGDPTSAAKDGDFMPIRKSEQMPEEIKAAIFALKPGQVSRPVRQPNGFYLFRLEGLDTEAFENVRTRLAADLRSLQTDESVRKMQQSIEVKIEIPDAFSSPAPAAAPK